MNTNISDILRMRRSIYGIGKAIPVSDKELTELLEETTRLVPDAFNMKSQRIVVALGDKHDKLWDEIYDAFEGKVPREKIDSFKAGYGTVLYFYDASVVSSLQEQYADYADNFPVWAQQSNGMLQLSIWAGLARLGIGASLQHYNPVIDDAVRRLFGLPKSYVLVAEMPFGEILEPADEKPEEDISLRVSVFS